MKYCCWSRASALFFLAGCVTTPVHSEAFRVENQADLIGGPSALGQVGDYEIRNGHLRAIIQDVGFSRGFAVYGGSLIDADLRHPTELANAEGGQGNDRFGELFPVFFLQACVPQKITIENDGSDGNPAKLVVTGTPGPFITVVNTLNDIAFGADDLKFSTEYSLGPNDRYVTITSTVSVAADSAGDFQPVLQLGSDTIPVPFGDVALMGTTNKVFIPGQAGFDLRFTLPEVTAASPRTLPALPGLVADFIATQNQGVSYGLFADYDAANDFAWRNKDQYGPDATPGSVEIPFFFSSFLGYYYSWSPKTIPAGSSFSFKQYFAVGRGDVADIRDIYNQERGIQTGTFAGRVYENGTSAPLAGVSVMVYDSQNRPFNQHTTTAQGDFNGTLPPGDYTYQVVDDTRPLLPPTAFHIDAGKTTGLDIFAPRTAMLNVQVTDNTGRGLPSAVIAESTYEPTTQTDPRKFLFDLARGDRRRQVDLIGGGDNRGAVPNPATRKFVEAQIYTPDGNAAQAIRPGNYTIYVARGPEYETFQQDLTLTAGQLTQLHVTLNRSFDSEGYVAGDLHLHSSNSIDSGLLPQDRVTGLVAEGLEFAVASDHNFVTDYSPLVNQMNLQQWLLPIVGVEMTTLEVGHYNGYPLDYNLASANRGAFPWFDRPAGDVFQQLRSLGKYGPENTIVQVNHPRDTLNGYFSQWNLSGDTGQLLPRGGLLESQGPSFAQGAFSLAFDALEVMNGKRWDLTRTVLAPNPLPASGNYPPGNAPGQPIRTVDGLVAYPGGVDDWFHLLDQGYTFTAVGNSDSHTNFLEEPGFPRTWVNIGKDEVVDIRELDIVHAIQQHKATIGIGVFVEMFANDQPIGSTITGGDVALRVRVRKPSWVEVDTLNVYANGVLWKSYPLQDLNDETITDAMTFSSDTFVIAEVTGTHDLFPIVTGLEEPPLTLGDALGTLSDAFGINGTPLGDLTINNVRGVFPYGVTNPIWVDVAGDGFTAPGSPTAPAAGANAVAPARVTYPDNDVRAIFKSFSHSHG